ncbi:galactoside O-acetyltransferase [Alkalihalobacillus alcalophilus ATCC 27647 = CGMCC 1.3604]|uniref:Acetyltransferase n=1 Tax=Alkalihalobacillus alcalophilus ATCC 27647 = CGMCC 1.3604 TaxID=1218173 RepID=A0A094YZH6_ALKAL|nr:sugar O-acetyltransferase [Alkalihalobacillus alcalophilus]KGA98967.1 galactoside O-acetyltransferase [Alkalihalobacillus alcalophilus ATCC 27647 = CGMCC 1.3604]MED1562006.1 sugar O-acetyltransferase [Alkalihalobacillus alcalophilus]THG89221.1 galactoside O-acetyltransferase [Alkalihalobacillus alcalophilus ATCC 27647 = CGMCC 1.3604]
MNSKEKMLSGELYDPTENELMSEQQKWNELLYAFNQTRPSESAKRESLLKKLLAECGDDCYVEPPLRANWGSNTHFGNGVYANFNLTLVDDAPVYVGNDVMFGPNVTIATAGHPIDPDLRKMKMQFNLAVTIKDNVWIGANSVVLPGITIGENSVIGAGSVVTKDIPANVVAVGNPCKVLREIGERDKVYYHKDRKINK